jgi:hypothetical protein
MYQTQRDIKMNEPTNPNNESEISNSSDDPGPGSEQGELERILAKSLAPLGADQIPKPSVGFKRRVQLAADAAQVVLDVRKRRLTQPTIDDLPLEPHLLTFVESKAVTQLRGWLGLEDFSGRQPGSGVVIGELARDIEMSLEEILIRLRIGLVGTKVSSLIEALVPATVGRRADGETRHSFSALKWEYFLSLQERDLPAREMWRLRTLEVEVRQGYCQHG